MTDHATPADREATPTPDGETVDLLIESFEMLGSIGYVYAECDLLRDRIRAHLFELARRGALFQAEEAN